MTRFLDLEGLRARAGAIATSALAKGLFLLEIALESRMRAARREADIYRELNRSVPRPGLF